MLVHLLICLSFGMHDLMQSYISQRWKKRQTLQFMYVLNYFISVLSFYWCAIILFNNHFLHLLHFFAHFSGSTFSLCFSNAFATLTSAFVHGKIFKVCLTHAYRASSPDCHLCAPPDQTSPPSLSWEMLELSGAM